MVCKEYFKWKKYHHNLENKALKNTKSTKNGFHGQVEMA
jgi:hypothetical protein